MYDERVSQEDMDSVYEQGYEKGYKDGAKSERPRAFGAGYEAGYDYALKITRCKDCKHDNNCEIQYAAQAGSEFFCGAAERRE